MSVESSSGLSDHDRDQGHGDDDAGEWVAEYCAWWVIPTGYSTQRSRVVHVPDAVRMREGNDPDDRPDADTLCYTDNRGSTDYQAKSHAVLPVGFRSVCSRCQTELTEVIADE